MPSITAPAPLQSRGTLVGISFKIASVLVFLVMSALLKACDGIPTGELVLFRSFFGIPPVIAFVAWQGGLRQLFITHSVVGQVWRGLVGTGSMWFGFYALAALPLPESVTLNYATPLMIVVVGALFMGETVRLYRWSAVVVGFIGVVVIAWPQLTLLQGGIDNEALLGIGAALAACVCAAIAMLLVRQLVQRERSSTIVIYFLISSTIIAALTLPFGWVMPTPLQLACLVGAGICGGFAQILLTEGYRHAEMSVVAPFEYTSLIFSVLIGYVFFGDVPTWFMLTGGIIVVASGLFIIYREHRLGKNTAKASEAREAVTPQG
jgi:drug/metabolite transporter (DMT)-like permease